MNLIIRPIEPQDNAAIAQIAITVLTEFGCIGPGYASQDQELHMMYETYQAEGARYWVVKDTETQRILGGGGFSRLKGTTVEEGICELQKVYFYPEARGHGLGCRIVTQCIEAATQAGYRQMYLESVPAMERAIGLYRKLGFEHIPCHMGNTGHQERCQIRMLRALQPKASANQQTEESLPVVSP